MFFNRSIAHLFGILSIACFLFIVSIDGSECEFEQKIKTGDTYYLVNNDYPNTTSDSMTCRWLLRAEKSTDKLKLNCTKVHVPTDTCIDHFLDVYTSESGKINMPNRHCGDLIFNTYSKADKMTVIYQRFPNSEPGKLMCSITAINY